MIRADYLSALHAALDARRDPLDDGAVRDWLMAHPEDLSEFAAMRAALAPVQRPARAPRRPPLWPMALPPLAAAAALLLFLRAERPQPPPPVPELSGSVLAVYEATSVASAQMPSVASPGAAVLVTSISFARTPAF